MMATDHLSDEPGGGRPGHSPGARSLSDRLHGLADRLLASPRFQRWAARFPLTRPIARRRAQALFDLCAGFVYSQILAAAVDLDLFTLLSGGPLTVAEVARRTGLEPAAAERILRAGTALRLFARRGGDRLGGDRLGGDRFGLGPLGAPIPGNPGIAAMVAHHRMLYADLADPVALLRRRRTDTALGGYWPYGGVDRPDALTDGQVRAYTALMAASQPMVAAEVLDAWPLHRHRTLLDVGGGDGSFLRAAAARAPRLELVLFDLPAVAATAAERFRETGLAGRTRCVGGSFHHDPLPTGADLITLVRVLHDHDDSDVVALLRRVRQAIPDHGTLLVAEPMAAAAGAEATGDAYFGFYLLAMGRGRPRTADELTGLLSQAGFTAIRRHPTATPMIAGLLSARPGPTGK
ncbi:MAG: hypothetical protein RLY86_1735 [Pseudomonadota bacterium]|jgi:demethylspheroidene O-methyltransferase